MRINLPGRLLRPLTISDRHVFQYEALRWSYALRNRERWNTQSDAVLEQQKAMSGLAASLGLTHVDLESIAEAGIVEVDIPWTQEDQDWELRIFPWEFLLATATREGRSLGRQPLTVVRRLRRETPPEKPARSGPPTNWLQVISAPGRLADAYDFEGERQLLELSVAASGRQISIVRNPDIAALDREVAAGRPHVIHLSGFDSHQGLALFDQSREATARSVLFESGREATVRDGFLLCSGKAGMQIVEAEQLAARLTSGQGPAPALIACNFYNSAARIAPLCVAAGTGAAIGFQDSFDDELVELFFTVIYQAWWLADWDVIAAFQYAWREVRDQQRPLQGSAVVLWSEESIAEDIPMAQAQVEARLEQIRDTWEKRSRQAPALTQETIRQAVEVVVEPIAELNYSILHNNGPLFKRFQLRKRTADLGLVEDLLIRVELYMGNDFYPYRFQAAIAETAPLADFGEQIRVSLVARLPRAIHESLRTSLFVEVTWHEVALFRSTFQVTLLPVDEWRYDRENYHWLPSFVLPGDPAILRIIDAAQLYLMVLSCTGSLGT